MNTSTMTGILFIYIFVCIAYCVSDSSNTPQGGQEESRISELISTGKCPGAGQRNCSELSNLCLNCIDYTANCTYGELVTVKCKPFNGVNCTNNSKEEYFTKQAKCVFCYQTEKWEYTCERKRLCQSGLTKPQKTNCTVHNDVMCLGYRTFEMKLKWNCTRGHKWSTALILSITLGGFGADRFYLGHWQEGIGKLFSFGGLGVWTLVDVLLIAIRYLGPADGSFYV